MLHISAKSTLKLHDSQVSPLIRTNTGFQPGVRSLYDPNLGNKCNLLGDHIAVIFLINMDKPIHPCREITYRKYSDICIPEFIRGLATNDLLNRPVGSLDYLIEGYNKGI